MRDMELDYRFTDLERHQITELLLALSENPYKDIEGHVAALEALVKNGSLPPVMHDIVNWAKNKNGVDKPFIYLANCPLDEDRPVFDFASPVESKYKLKKTFVAEGFLGLLAAMTDTHSVRYGKMNNGDAFHDVFPMEQMKDTRSQKSLVSLGHHQDFPIHFARPRWVHLMAIRNPVENKVFTTFVRNKDVFGRLSHAEQEVLSQPIFHTPYDDVTKHGDSNNSLNDVDGLCRPIKVGKMLNYYEGRTESDEFHGRTAIDALNKAIAEETVHVRLKEGELVSFDNDRCLHGRDVVEITNPESHKTRWLIKSHTLPELGHLSEHFIEGRETVLNG